ncbi:MAG: hypothetical protein HZB29_08190 [Nitrospinae bacterium]|nr:hypothetical protein [Nitrospinota bacterium]
MSKTSFLPPEELESPSWYAVYVRHQSEYKISSVIRDKLGIESLVPSLTLWKKRGNRESVITKPVFGSYVFIKTNLRAINLRLLYSINGIFDLVRQGGAPAPIAEKEIESVNVMLASGAHLHEMEFSRRLKPYDRVEVTGGPLAGAVGYFMRTNIKSGRFVVSLDLFNRALVTELEADLVKAW